MTEETPNLISDQVDLLKTSGLAPMRFETVYVPTASGTPITVDHALDGTRRTTVKLIFHFKNVAIKDMNAIGKLLWELVHRFKFPQATASASPSPVYRNQWDFIYFDVPLMQGELTRRAIIQEILKLYGKV